MQAEIHAANPVVDIAIPVYNEERDLEASVRVLHAYLAAHVAHTTRITIVDNASTDGTPAIGMRLAHQVDGVRFLRLEEKGRGRALRTAWRCTRDIATRSAASKQYASGLLVSCCR